MEHGFGPAPREMVGDQRYNTSGHPSWYFADNHEAAVAEVTSKGKAWVQKFDIGNLGELLDLRSWRSDDGRALDDDGEYRPPHGPLLIALIYCDLLTQRNFDEERERRWKPEYLLTRFVAEAAKQAGFNGILYQSVRYPGDNLVVFDAGWKPTPIGEPYEVVLDEKAQYTRKYFGFNRGKTYEPDWFAELPITGPI
jgi:hypothetical protein